MENSIGIIEIKSIAKGIEACDSALKSAGVKLITAQPICPGKYEIILTGNLADVQAAVDHVGERNNSNIIDTVKLGRISECVVKALFGAETGERKGSVGVIETYSAASAIMAADTAVKAANVSIIELRLSRGMGGKGYVMITGDVSDVTAAVEAGSRYAADQGLLTGNTVIAAPHEELWQYM